MPPRHAVPSKTTYYVSVQSRRQFPSKHVVFPPNLCLFMFLRTLCQKPRGVGEGAPVAFLKKNFKSVGISGEINVRPCHFLPEPNEFIGRCYRTRLGPTFLGSYRGASAIRGVNLFFLTSLPHYLLTSI